MPLSPRSRRCLWALLILAPSLAVDSAVAQQAAPEVELTDTTTKRIPWWESLVTSGGVAENRLRLRQILEGAPTQGFLIRSPASLLTAPSRSAGSVSVQLLAPELRFLQNSQLPFTQNDGALWAGRGLNLEALAGARLRVGPVTAVIAPQLVHQENAAFQTIPYGQWRRPRRDPFASPWYGPPHSMDYPLRFGTAPSTRVEPGQSSLEAGWGAWGAGIATESLWWGPGIRNAIVMSSNAPGIPHLFVRTREPVAVGFGRLEGRWILGRLEESDYFDADSTNDVRSLSAAVLTFTPNAEPNLMLGLARAVYASTERGAIGPGAFFDVLRNVGRPNALPSDSLVTEGYGHDQIFSLFGRWVFPESGFETYLEWARFEQPRSLRDLLVDPGHTQGYTLGLQWARPVWNRDAVRLQAELTNLELSASSRYRPIISTYASRAVPQGYTHRGQVIGAAIGPGASSQWLALDYVARGWEAGAFGGRIRWNNAAFYTAAVNPTMYSHDVSVLAGVRGGLAVGRFALAAEYTAAQRINYLFQTFFRGPGNVHSVNVRNNTLQLSVSALPGPR